MQRPTSDSGGSTLRVWMTDPAVHAVIALGITQITAWGTTYYALGVLAKPIAQETGWPSTFVYMGFTVALIVMSAVSTRIGRMIDERGGRMVMSAGSLACTAGLVALAYAPNVWVYLGIWALLGITMRMTLYDAAFSSLVQVAPTRGRRAISYLTLFGGFASSVFWPIGHYLAAGLGWRQTILVFALLNLIVCLPLHWFGLARCETDRHAGARLNATATTSTTGHPLEGASRTLGIILFAGIMSLNGFTMSALSVHMVPILEATGIGAALAVWLASLKGVAQVGGRAVEMTVWRNLHPLTVGRIALLLVPLSFAILYGFGMSFNGALAFTLVLGAGQGIITIVRGAVPLALFGTKGYGEVLGVIATPILLVNALAPPIFSLLVENYGSRLGQIVLLAFAVIAWGGMEAMVVWYGRRSKTSDTPSA